MKTKHTRLLFLLLFLLLPFSTAPASAQTLYERSLSLLTARAQQASPDDYTFVVMGDSREGDAVFEKALRTAAGYRPLFILHGGDYSNKGTAAETASFLALVRRVVPDIPLFVVLGNHEEREVFRREIGPGNFTLSEKRLGLTLIALDNAVGALNPPEISRLRSELAAAFGTVFVAMHIPPKTERWDSHAFTKGADDLKKILEGGRVTAAFFSHSHLFDRAEFGGVPAFITGGAGAPLVWFSRYGERVNHILVVHVKKGRATYRMVPLT